MFRRNDGPKNPDDQIKRDGINNSPESKGPQLDKSVNALEKKDPPANKQGGEKLGQNPEKTLKTPPANKPETRKTEKLTPPPANKSEKKEREREFMQPAPPKKEAKQMIGRNLENRAAPVKKEGVANKAEKNLRTPPARKPDVRAEAKKTEAEKKDQPKVNEKKLDWNVDKIKNVCQKVNEAKDTKEAKQKYYTKDIAQKIQKAEKQLEQSIKNKDEEINKLNKIDPDNEKKRESLQEEKEKRMDQLDQVREAGKEVKDFREGQRLDQTDNALTENYRKAKDEGLSEKQRQEVMSPQAEQALEKHKEDLKNRIDGINEKMDKLEKDGKKDSKEYSDLIDERLSREKQLAAADLMLGETKDFVRETAKENSKDRLHAERSESRLGKKRDLQKDQDCVRYNDAAIKSLEKDKTKAVQERDNVRAEIADMVNNYSEDALRQKPEFEEKMKEYDALCDKVEGYDSQIKNLKNCNERLVEINGKDEAGKDRLSVNRFDAQADDKKIAETIEAVSERAKLDNNDKKPDEKEKQENKALAEKTEREVIPALKEQISGLDYEISAAENYLKNHNDEGMQDYKKDLEKEREDKAQQLDYLEKGAKVLSGEASDQEKREFNRERFSEGGEAEGQQLDKAQEKIVKDYEAAKKEGLEKSYRHELFYPKEQQSVEKLQKGLDEQKQALQKRADSLKAKANKLEEEGKTRHPEYILLKKECSKLDKQLDKINALSEDLNKMQIQKGMQMVHNIGERDKNGEPDLKNENPYVAEKYLENAKNAINKSIESWQDQKARLDPKDSGDKIKQLDGNITYAEAQLSLVEEKLSDVRDVITTKSTKELEKVYAETEKKTGENAEKEKQERYTPSIKNKLNRTLMRVKETEAYFAAEEKKPAKTVKLKRKRSKKIAERNENEKIKKSIGGQLTEERNKRYSLTDINKDLQKAEKKQKTPEATQNDVTNAEKKQEKKKVTLHEKLKDDTTKRAFANMDFLLSACKMVKDITYNPGDLAKHIKNSVDFYSKAEKLKKQLKEGKNKEGAENKKETKRLPRIAKDMIPAIPNVVDTVTGIIAKDGKKAGEAIGKTIGKLGSAVNLKSDFEKKQLNNAISLVGDVMSIATISAECAVKPGAFLKKGAEFFDKTFSVAEKIKEGMEALLEDRYGKKFDETTEFISKADRLLYELVKDRPKLAFLDLIKTTLGTTLNGREAMDGMADEYVNVNKLLKL